MKHHHLTEELDQRIVDISKLTTVEIYKLLKRDYAPDLSPDCRSHVAGMVMGAIKSYVLMEDAENVQTKV